MANDIAIKVENLSKYYKLGVINNGTLFRDIQSWWARKLGKEDPHAKLGSKYDPTAEGFWALKDLNFEIKKGDRVGIIGHNGAGKSTLLKLLSQITSPTEGSIKINGKIASLLEVGTGFHPEMTGRENIYMNGAILGMSHDEIDKKVQDIIDFSEIGEHIDTPVKRYSSGMYVRLAFAVAAHLDSDILIADEVLAVGDAAFQKKALGKMNELSSGEGRTVLFVSHNMAQVKNLCNKGILLNHGRIDFDSDIDTVIDEYFHKNSGNLEKEKTDIEIDELKLVINKIHVTEGVSSLKPFEIDLEIYNNSNHEYNDIGLQVMIFDSVGKRLIGINPLETEGIDCPIKCGINHITCKIKSLPLCMGIYYLGISVIKPNFKIYFEQEQLLKFTVKEEIINKRLLSNNPAYGLFYTDSEWSFK